MKISKVFYQFYENAKGGVMLILCTLVSILLANSSMQESYIGFWHNEYFGLSIEQWVNDGLMAVFFFLIGLELKRELLVGELSDLKKALLPVFAAIGGMLVPAGIFFFLNKGLPTQAGAGIPMATDIAFAIGVLSLLGKRVPASLKILLTAIAVIDDLGAILVIAIFYTNELSLLNLGIVIAIFGGLMVMNRLKVNITALYIIGGIFMWYFMLKSGVHATLAGILLAFTIPFGKGEKNTMSYRLEDALDEPVAWFVLPIFALANTSIVFSTGWDTGLAEPGSLGIILGLVVGKPVGVLLFSSIAVGSGLCLLPKGMKWLHIVGIGLLAGIGFTMSFFITLLAFNDPHIITESKISILLASLASGLLGFGLLKTILKKPSAKVVAIEKR